MLLLRVFEGQIHHILFPVLYIDIVPALCMVRLRLSPTNKQPIIVVGFFCWLLLFLLFLLLFIYFYIAM